MILYAVTDSERRYIDRIAERAVKTMKGFDRLHVEMNITACHSNGCPLDLHKLLFADDFNFMHDICGIDKHINKETGELGGCFVPRFKKHS